MTSDSYINIVYQFLCKAYEPITREIIVHLMRNREGAERPKVIFPPNDGATFDAQMAESGFLQRNCAVISAFRRKNPDGTRRYKKENLASSAALEKDMLDLGLTYFPLDGCFREKEEKNAAHETSFFVYDDGSHQARQFFQTLYRLSEKYLQDSFLYKSEGMSRLAFLISTNDKTREEDGDINPAGKLYLNLTPVGPYSDLQKGKKGRFTFRIDPPTEEELEYSRRATRL